jgi:hypothetical protein
MPRYPEAYDNSERHTLEIEKSFFKDPALLAIHNANQRFWYTPKATFSISRLITVTGEDKHAEVLRIPVEEGYNGPVYLRDVQMALRPITDGITNEVWLALASVTYRGLLMEFACALTVGEVGISLGTGWAQLSLPKCVACSTFRIAHNGVHLLAPVIDREGFQGQHAGAAVIFPDKNGMYLVTLTATNWWVDMPTATVRSSYVLWDVMLRWDYGVP